MTDDEAPASRAEQGRRRRERAQGKRADDLQNYIGSVAPELPDIIDEVIFGTLWDRPALTHEEQMLIAITALVAQGNEAQLRNYLFGALQDGIPAAKVRDLIVMCAVYCGFPNTINARALLTDVVRSLRRQGAFVAGADDDEPQ
jgi:4-carboxymuconolactone decarboxylase